MGTEKRERQKANRALRLQQEQKDEQRSRYGRIALWVGLALVGILILVLAVQFFAGDDDTNDQSAEIATEEATNGDASDEATDDEATTGEADD